MQQHVGKKRRKEVREAVDMRKELRSRFARTGVVFGIGVAFVIGMQALTVFGVLALGNEVAQAVLLIVVFVFVMIIGSRTYKWSGMREQYKEHRKRYNITDEDMRALERGQL